MDVKEAIDNLQELKSHYQVLEEGKFTNKYRLSLDVVLSELEKKEAVINEMADTISSIMTGVTAIQNQFEEEYCEFIKSDEDCCWKTDKECSDCIKEYFIKKVADINAGDMPEQK